MRSRSSAWNGSSYTAKNLAVYFPSSDTDLEFALCKHWRRVATLEEYTTRFRCSNGLLSTKSACSGTLFRTPDGERTKRSFSCVISDRPSQRAFIFCSNLLPVFLLNGGSAISGYSKAFFTQFFTSVI